MFFFSFKEGNFYCTCNIYFLESFRVVLESFSLSFEDLEDDLREGFFDAPDKVPSFPSALALSLSLPSPLALSLSFVPAVLSLSFLESRGSFGLSFLGSIVVVVVFGVVMLPPVVSSFFFSLLLSFVSLPSLLLPDFLELRPFLEEEEEGLEEVLELPLRLLPVGEEGGLEGRSEGTAVPMTGTSASSLGSVSATAAIWGN